MKERPILFSAPMVRAILEGKKTQTRRIVGLDTLKRSDTPGHDFTWRGKAPIRSVAQQRRHPGGCWQDVSMSNLLALCPYGAPGDRLWVRETHAQFAVGNRSGSSPQCVAYRTTCADDGSFEYVNNGDEVMRLRVTKWTPGIHMPRWASRILLEIVEVRVQRLLDITDEDARAEGVAHGLIPADDYGPVSVGYVLGSDDGKCLLSPTPREAFAIGWDHINGARASWSSNPWVWALTFRRVEDGR